ncbi:rhomboid family intramembrane serine protease [Rodentibacter pneumotropicus]|uniref:Rhomboid protease GlpG n=1 Tax=Rodentibacter pneumotropicus TaxID=758 RepID=A0A3S4VZQ6_9PAST|nr:rhomboid family intramembrane serine protease [Rodentibacter pneumotropicus]NBH75921.1 rhomboid family intramembrane serine protease [Rodentibacter pneumotropicus]OOF61889.1 rhomboid family intramembrane serine protease [Rodentibacter pneumotropicus]THA01192.1 rhomboid family intramembrane serine protease [Rodentibacter pneumotropicus]THA05811.1 rhomboid family intramembrane serine protease [Rodentibacter pneumotropicus]THA12806.1 rhomboid family intramembrane serine protease [Rodentibacter
MKNSDLSRYFTPLHIITAICVIVYLLQQIGFEESIMDAFHYPVYFDQDWELWRYISHSFVHLSNIHIIANLSWFWLFGSVIERYFGGRKLFFIFLVSAMVSGIVQNYFSGAGFFGLSGVVYAVLGYVFVVDKLNANIFNLPKGFFTMLLVGLIFGFISPLFDIYIGNAAHVSGLLVGLLWGFIDSKIYLNHLQ